MMERHWSESRSRFTQVSIPVHEPLVPLAERGCCVHTCPRLSRGFAPLGRRTGNSPVTRARRDGHSRKTFGNSAAVAT